MTQPSLSARNLNTELNLAQTEAALAVERRGMSPRPMHHEGAAVNWHGILVTISPDGRVLHALVDDTGFFAEIHGAPVTHARAEQIATAAMRRNCESLHDAWHTAYQDWQDELRGEASIERWRDGAEMGGC